MMTGQSGRLKGRIGQNGDGEPQAITPPRVLLIIKPLQLYAPTADARRKPAQG